MGIITTRRFNIILSIVDLSNYVDFDSFIAAVMSTKIGITQEMMENIMDFLIFDLNITCDADLTKLPQKKLKEIIIGMNDIIMSTARRQK